MSDKIPFIILKIDNHLEVKNKILDAIKYAGKNKYQEIYNTDWGKDKNYPRPYYEFLKDIFNNISETVTKIYQYSDKLEVKNYWFQQYTNNDSHDWHIHKNCLFSCVYYIELCDETPKTSFKLFNEEFDISINEGEVLIFPSFLLHCSKPNKSNKTKTVVAFNLT